MQLTDQGRQILGGCAADSLRAKAKFRKKNGKKGKSSTTTALDLDLGKCSVPSENPVAKPYKGDPIPTANADRCDFLDPAVCLQPWPNDYFTVADGTTDTGRRLDLNQAVDAEEQERARRSTTTDYLRADGFSPGNMIIVKVPEVQTQAAFDNSGIVPINNLRAYDDDNQPVVVINAETGERHPVWAEVDANPLLAEQVGQPGQLEPDHQAGPQLRRGRTATSSRCATSRTPQGNPVEPPLPFRVYRDRLITQQAPVESRRPHIESLISTLQQNGFQRSNLYMAWDFTVASEDSLTGRAVDMRDDALLRIGDAAPGDPIDGDEDGDDTPGDGVIDGAAPSFTITGTSDPDGPGGNVLRQVDGELTNVPCYLDQATAARRSRSSASRPGADDPTLDPSSFARRSGGQLRRQVPLHHPRVGRRRRRRGGAGQAGHLRPRPARRVHAGERPGAARATSRTRSGARPTGPASPRTTSRRGQLLAGGPLELPPLVDRMQQGFVNFHYLGRAMQHPDGFNDDPAFQVDAGSGLEPVIDTSTPLLRGDQPGRDHGRRADRALARHRALGAERERHELLDAAAPQRRLRRVRRAARRSASTPSTRTSSSGR